MHKNIQNNIWHTTEYENRLIFHEAPRPQYNIPEESKEKGEVTKAELTEEEKKIASRFFEEHREEVVDIWTQIQQLDNGNEKKTEAFQKLASEYRSEVLDQLYLLEVEMNEENENYKMLTQKVENIMNRLRNLVLQRVEDPKKDGVSQEPVQDGAQIASSPPERTPVIPPSRTTRQNRNDTTPSEPIQATPNVPRARIEQEKPVAASGIKVPQEDLALRTGEMHELSPEEIEEMKEKHMKLLLSYREMSKKELLAKTTPEEIAKRSREGTLYILLLAINSKDENNLVEKNSTPENMYSSIIDNIVDEGMELRKEILKAKKMSAAQLQQQLETPPFADYFKQEKLPRVDIQLDQMSEEQLRKLYESCLLEKQAREANIMYTAGGSFWATALPESGYNIYRQGDCNTVASYYHSLASLSGSSSLSSSLRSIIVDGHAQVCFDLGKDNRGKNMIISKNTSHVDMSKVDSEGRWSGKNYPYAHNFYDIQHDMDSNGADIDTAIQDEDALVASQIGELRKGGRISRSSNTELQREKELFEKVLSLNPHDATENSNYISGLFVMLDRRLIPEGETKKQAGKALENYIEASYWSGFPLINFTRRFGRTEAHKFITQYENKIMSDPRGFSRFVRSSVISMRHIPDFDRRMTGTENSVSLSIENRRNMLRSVVTFLPSQRAKETCQKELDYLNQEMRHWRPVNP